VFPPPPPPKKALYLLIFLFKSLEKSKLLTVMTQKVIFI
jgi:hypothetical protein